MRFVVNVPFHYMFMVKGHFYIMSFMFKVPFHPMRFMVRNPFDVLCVLDMCC